MNPTSWAVRGRAGRSAGRLSVAGDDRRKLALAGGWAASRQRLRCRSSPAADEELGEAGVAPHPHQQGEPVEWQISRFTSTDAGRLTQRAAHGVDWAPFLRFGSTLPRDRPQLERCIAGCVGLREFTVRFVAVGRAPPPDCPGGAVRWFETPALFPASGGGTSGKSSRFTKGAGPERRRQGRIELNWKHHVEIELRRWFNAWRATKACRLEERS